MVEQGVSANVPFNTENAGKCRCPKCPVQIMSVCASNKKETLKDALARQPLNREDIPGVYCSTGKATCDDLDHRQICFCGNCPVFAEYNLREGKLAGYFCRDGSAIF